MSHIALAELAHRDALAALWAEAFGDSEAFISSFLEAYMIPGHNVPAVISGGEPVSALYLLDFPLYSYGKAIGDCAYLFAAATKEGHKRQGHMSELIGYAAGLCREMGQKAIFLFPQNPKLFDFYAKFGFETVYAATKTRGKGSPFGLAEKNIADPGTFERLYGAYAKFSAGQALAPLKDRRFYLECARAYLDDGGHFAAPDWINEHNSEKFFYVFYKKYKNIYYIDDIIPIEPTKEGFGDAAAALAEVFSGADPGAGFEMTLPPLPGKSTPLAMLMPLCEEVREIIRGLEAPVYINMFMNV